MSRFGGFWRPVLLFQDIFARRKELLGEPKPHNCKDSKPLAHGAELSALLWGLVAAMPRFGKFPVENATDRHLSHLAACGRVQSVLRSQAPPSRNANLAGLDKIDVTWVTLRHEFREGLWAAWLLFRVPRGFLAPWGKIRMEKGQGANLPFELNRSAVVGTVASLGNRRSDWPICLGAFPDNLAAITPSRPYDCFRLRSALVAVGRPVFNALWRSLLSVGHMGQQPIGFSDRGARIRRSTQTHRRDVTH
jgi:hypothetical protein